MMLGSVFLKTLRDQRRAMVWWCLGLALLTALLVAFYPSIQGIENFQSVIEAYPEELMALFGANDLSDFTSPAGYLNAELFGFMAPFLFIIFAVAQGSFAVAGEERAGTLELLLSAPITRGRLILEKFASMVTLTGALAAVLWVVLAVGRLPAGMDISMLRLAEMTISVSLLGLTFGSVAFAVGSAKGGRGLSVGVAAAATVTTYLLSALSKIASAVEPAQWISPFYYYNENNPLVNGLNLVHATVLVVVILSLTSLAYWGFQRRDLRL